MTTVTVVAEDRRIIVDGEVLMFDFPVAPEIWAVQWNGTQGHIEYRDNRMPEPIDEKAASSWIALHTAEKERRRIEEETTATAVEAARLRDPDARKAELADIRWNHQVAGIVVDEIGLRTDRESILDLADIAGRTAASFPTTYKAGSGFVTLSTKAQATKLNKAQTDHVQACFDREAVLFARIEELVDAPDELAALELAEGWPS